jgi:hypothetical protein
MGASRHNAAKTALFDAGAGARSVRLGAGRSGARRDLAGPGNRPCDGGRRGPQGRISGRQAAVAPPADEPAARACR